MASFNKVILMGNLTRDPQLKYLPSQMAVAEFGLAASRRWKSATGEEKEDVLFVDCTAWGKTGETINKYFTKGKPIFIEGRLKLDQWEDKQGGGKRSKITVVVENFQFIGAPAGGGGGGAQAGNYEGDEGQRPQGRPAAARPANNAAPAQNQPPLGEEEHFKEDDIPF